MKLPINSKQHKFFIKQKINKEYNFNDIAYRIFKLNRQ